MFSLLLTIIFPIAFTSVATPTNDTVDCEALNGLLNAYEHPNVSSSYSIPAVVSTGSTIMNSTTQTWQIVNSISNSIGNTSDSSKVVDPQAQQLSQFLFLDTLSTLNGSSSSPLPFAGCSFIFELPSSYIGETSSDGSCGKFFGQSCLNELMQIAQDTTATIPPALSSTNLIDACNAVSETVNNYIDTSSKGCSKTGPAIGVSQGMNFSSIITDNCTTPPTTLPIQLPTQNQPFQQGNNTAYDQWTKTATPILLAFFSNDATMNYAQTYLTCTSPTSVTAGAHDSTSAADRAAVADVNSVVGFALAINALVFFML